MTPIVSVVVASSGLEDPEGQDLRNGPLRKDAARLELRALLAHEDHGNGRHLSGRALALEGKRVRMVGFMARMSIAPAGAFYLVQRPVFCDEAGGGRADLPPEAVRVQVPSAAGREIVFNPRRLEVTGILEVGDRAEADGLPSHIRLVLDGAVPRRAPPARARNSAGKESRRPSG